MCIMSCPSGEVLMKDGSCGVCPPGTGYSDSRLKCSICGSNTYSTGKGTEQRCRRCPSGSYSLPGSDTCPCTSGTALIIEKGEGECGVCPPGTYYHEYSARCLNCGRRSVSPGGIGNSNDSMSCVEGTVPNEDGTACV